MRGKQAALITILGLVAIGVGAAACAPADLEGTPLERSAKRSSSKSSDKKKTSTSGEEETATAESEISTPTGTQSAPLDAGTPNPPQDAAPVTTATTPPPPPPPPPPPACGSPDARACFGCCIDANPGAIAIENAFDDCLFDCFDSQCDQACQSQHVANCNGSAACRSHHACLQANGCAAAAGCD